MAGASRRPSCQVVRRAPVVDTQAPLPGAAAVDRLTAPACPYPVDVPCPPPLPPYGGPLHERPKLTGDWFGARTGLRDRGITVDVSTTQFYQGVTSGGLEQSFPYGGRNDYFLTLDGEKLGLWKGFSVKLHGETRYGESANFLTGALSPVNEYLLVPGSDGSRQRADRGEVHPVPVREHAGLRREDQPPRRDPAAAHRGDRPRGLPERCR